MSTTQPHDHLPGNPFLDYQYQPADQIAFAVRALAFEQHQRNRLAAITATHRGIELPADLAALATEEGAGGHD